MAFYHRGLRAELSKLSPTNVRDAVAAARSDSTLLVDWVHRGPVKENWGDAVAPVIAGHFSGKRIVNQRDVFNLARRDVYTTIGSMLGSIEGSTVVVWGSGFVDSRATLRCRPKRICAVRGPLSRAKLIEQGVDCPETFGDPALLYPMIYRPEVERTHRLGIIPHFREHDMEVVDRLRRQDDVLVIDIRSGLHRVADDINRCHHIASSSLHGLVAADGYGIPAIWIRFSDRPTGDGFKFRDYLESTGSRTDDPLFVAPTTTVDQILDRFETPRIDVDIDAFLQSCPFLDRSRF